MTYANERTAVLGPAGSLVPVWTTGVGLSIDRPTSVVRTLGRAKAFRGRSSNREWSVSSDFGTGLDMSGLMWLAEYGNPPFVWYPPDAVFGNILEPAVAGLVPGKHNGIEGGLVEVELGVWVKSALPVADSVLLPYRAGAHDPVAVVPLRPVTVSAWMKGTMNISILWRDVTGALMSTSSLSLGSSTTLARRTRTATPPVGAASMSLQFYCSQLAGPTVSFTSEMTPYSPGKGCQRSVVHGLSEALKLVTEQATLSQYSFTVSEVG